MKVQVFDTTGKEIDSIELNETVFGASINEGLVHRALLLQLANKRQSGAHTKTRGEVRGSTRKLFRQKGTGRARAGANRSPIRIGGGVAMGPRSNRNFTLQMNKKERRRALYSVLTSKVQENMFIVVRDLEPKEISTKHMASVFAKLPLGKTSLLALGEKNEKMAKSASNLKTVKVISSNYLNMADLLKFETLVVPESTIASLNALAS